MYAIVLHHNTGEYSEEVAKVTAPHKMKIKEFLSYVWEQTNHIQHDWTINESIELRTTNSPRSSMVGDVFCLYWKNFFGFNRTEWYEVAPVGFKPWKL